ncbi:MAG: dihydroxyacetone kinase subunit DhaK [Eubacteriales bacterium]|nr:dihydroxyacetone kinase subunit DhaK [Eubacteriales bacterium]
MKCLVDPEYATRDSAQGLAIVYPEMVQTIADSYSGRALLRRPIESDRVNIIASAGGFGAPFATGFVTADHFCDVGINGGPFAAPSAYDIYEAAKYIDSKEGYLLIYNNFMGDQLNNDLALELLELEGYRGKLFQVRDDCLSVDPDAQREERTGLIGGVLLTTKIASEAAVEGKSLDEIYELLTRANRRISSLNVTYDFEKKQTMLGEGISGENPRIIHENCLSLEESAKYVYDYLYQDLQPLPGEKLYLVVSRTFRTGYEDLFSFVKYFHNYAETRKPLQRVSAGHYIRMDISYGFSVTMFCADEELEKYLAKRTYAESFVL